MKKLSFHPEKQIDQGNLGLRFYKFMHLEDDYTFGNMKRDRVRQIVEHPYHPKDYNEYKERYQNLILNQGGIILVFESVTNFVTGMGLSHPIENGFAWHHSLGVPYIPGSSIKGALRSAYKISMDLGEEGYKEETLKTWFGDKESGVGKIEILDALPIGPYGLEVDVMTPHYNQWYQDDKAPGDWESPVPIPFLSVKPGFKVMFGLIPRPDLKGSVDAIKAHVIETLENLGLGAKTSSGYGVFRYCETESEQPTKQFKERQEQQKEQELKAQKSSSPKGKAEVDFEDCKDEQQLVLLCKRVFQQESEEEHVYKLALKQLVVDGKYAKAWKAGGPCKGKVSEGKNKLKELSKAVRDYEGN